jgi:hypothetical protein
MREYFLCVNGMGGLLNADGSILWDDDLFRFWPLEELVCVAESYANLPIQDPTSFFIFADHSVMLPAFAIHLYPAAADANEVIAFLRHAGNAQYSASVVARSFVEFVESYLRDEASRLDLCDGVRPSAQTIL